MIPTILKLSFTETFSVEYVSFNSNLTEVVASGPIDVGEVR